MASLCVMADVYVCVFVLLGDNTQLYLVVATKCVRACVTQGTAIYRLQDIDIVSLHSMRPANYKPQVQSPLPSTVLVLIVIAMIIYMIYDKCNTTVTTSTIAAITSTAITTSISTTNTTTTTTTTNNNNNYYNNNNNNNNNNDNNTAAAATSYVLSNHYPMPGGRIMD